MIAEAAYYRAQRRGFENGSPIDDWLQAEAEVNDALLDSEKPMAERSRAITSNRRPVDATNPTLR